MESNLKCIECGYDLRGIDPAGVCPECGASIQVSSDGGYFSYQDPFQLLKIKLGFDLATLGAMAAVVGLLPIILFFIQRQFAIQNFWLPEVLHGLFSLVSSVERYAWVGAAFLITAPWNDESKRLRKLALTIRVLTVAALLLGPLTRPFYRQDETMQILRTGVNVAEVIAFYLYLKGLGEAAGDQVISYHATFVMMVIAAAVMLPALQTLRINVPDNAEVVIFIVSAGGYVYRLWLTVYAWRLFCRAAKAARRRWESLIRQGLPVNS